MPAIRDARAGAGVILMFHEIHRDPASQLMTGTGAAFLDHALGWVKRNGWDIVGMDEALRRLSGQSSGRRFAVITFDDGYRDNLTVALPILGRHAAPFTVYVPTAAVERTLHSWWLGLRTAFIERETVEIEAMGQRFDAASLESKMAGFAAVQGWVRQDLRRAALLEPSLKAAGISTASVNDRLFLDARELAELAAHPLVTIGAHTATHPALATLEVDAVRRELDDNRSYLQRLLGRPIDHLAYPYGGAQACGGREAVLAEQLGFASAVTTRFQRLTRQSHRFLLPRLPMTAALTPTRFEAQMNGLLYQPAGATVPAATY